MITTEPKRAIRLGGHSIGFVIDKKFQTEHKLDPNKKYILTIREEWEND